MSAEWNPARNNLPTRRVAAIAIFNSQNLVLMVQRSDKVDEFRRAWSFPSCFIDDDVADNQIEAFLLSKIHNWLRVETHDVCLAIKRMGVRSRWNLLMHLYIGATSSTPSLQTEKYTDYRWLDGEKFLKQFDYASLGDCSKAYLEYLSTYPQQDGQAARGR